MIVKPRFARALLALLIALGARSALAIDTFESYPIGLHAAEAYLVRYGQGADDDALRGYLAINTLAVGLTGRSHVYACTGLSSTDRYEGGLEWLTAGYFQTLVDQQALDVDGWAELGARGPGLETATRELGVEVNYDGPRGGLFFRGTQRWERDGENEGGDPVVGLRRRFSYGIHFKLGPAAQLLAELRQERLADYQSLESGSRTESWALGFNRKLNQTAELILEARAMEPPADSELDRSWDLTLGWVVVW
ncbi:hypothetical protein FJ251_04085 [bacterium]|nr:hypothetical protein [bacterium]